MEETVRKEKSPRKERKKNFLHKNQSMISFNRKRIMNYKKPQRIVKS